MSGKIHSAARIPRATYRFQFNEHFHLNDALLLVPYLHELGISHIYASPMFKACPHSLHGYDVCDFSRLNPELGTEAELANLVAALHARNMGLVLDIVPNHMGVGGPENIWWWDVLTHGEKSKFASHFDIDWQPAEEELRGKILAPVLGDDYRALLNKGEFQLRFENEHLVMAYHQHRFPLTPASTVKLPVDAASLKKFNADFAALDRLIQQQNYLLAHYQTGDARLNYRRFFAVSTLAAMRVEDENVFNDIHVLIRRWYEQGWIDGLRVDHPDGLRDPEQYLQRLRALAPDAWIVVEKILESQELLPDAWPVAGTTGYDFLNQAGGIFIDPDGEKAMTDFYTKFSGETGDYAALVHEKKRIVLKTLLAAEVQRLAKLLRRIAAEHKGCEYFTPQQFTGAIVEMAVFFPVYRSYIAPDRGTITEIDLANIQCAARLSCEKPPDDSAPKICVWIRDLFVQHQPSEDTRDFICRFQQLTGPTMAKGVEDTAFFCFNRLQALNEVGGDPGQFGVRLENFYIFCDYLQRHWPGSMLMTSSHDTKRSEDVRARLDLLSEIPEIWSHTVWVWSAMNACHRGEWPDRNMEYLFYQTLVGAWPLSVDRALAFMEKAALEAKQYTTWMERNAAYETALRNFISEAMRDPEFTANMERFVGTLTDAGHINSLAQTLVKLTAPGVPDIYQGCELWDFSLVDPDNRRPVDFQLCHNLLSEVKNFSAEKAWQQRNEGVPKLWLIHRVLNLRARRPEWFTGDYQALSALGTKAQHLVAFTRDGNILTMTPRFPLKLKNDWGDTMLTLPSGDWRNEFTDEIFSGLVSVARLFQKFPVALLTRKENG